MNREIWVTGLLENHQRSKKTSMKFSYNDSLVAKESSLGKLISFRGGATQTHKLNKEKT
jgi:hypothetical protein